MNLESPARTPSPIHDANELLQDTEDLLQYGTWIWTPHTGTMELSHGMYRLLGHAHLSSGNISLTDFLQHLDGGEAGKFQQQLNAAVESRSPFRLMHTLTSAQGHNLRVLTKGKVIERNGHVRIMGVSQDFSRLPHLAEDMVQHRKLMDQYEIFLKFGTWQYSTATEELHWSVGMFSLFGYDITKDNVKVTEALYEKHIDPEDYQKGVALRKEAQTETNNDYFWQYRIVSATGEHKWLETYAHLSRDEEGKLTGTFGITRDITRLKLYEYSLESKIRELNRSNAELEEFAYVASHDMQEPLRKLTTFSERLTTRFGEILQDEGKLYLDRMAAATTNMRMLIDNLLDFSRIARTDDAFEKTDLNEVLQKALADLEVSIEETQATITSAKLPVIEAQAPLMKQLFTNVISNAIKFRSEDVSPKVIIECERLSAKEADKLHLHKDEKYFKIEIKDNGIGFEPEYAQRIFQIFQRLHGKAEYPGSGIGLAICKKIADYHNGQIYAQAQLSKGATITIVLPEKQ